MVAVEKIPYTPSLEKRFEISDDPISRARARALLKTFRELKAEIPFFAGFTLSGSLSKGKVLIPQTAASADIDLNVFLDSDRIPGSAVAFAQQNEDFRQFLEDERVKDRDFYERFQGYSWMDTIVQQAETQGVARAVIEYTASFVRARMFQHTFIENGDRVELDIVSYLIAKEGQNAIERLAEEKLVDRSMPIPFLGGSSRLLAAPFGLDIGGGLREYRRAFIRKLQELSSQEAAAWWGSFREAMMNWERNYPFDSFPGPDKLTSQYPMGVPNAARYYGGPPFLSGSGR